MDFVEYHIETSQDFWAELDDILNPIPPLTPTQVTASLRTFLHFTAAYHDRFLDDPRDLEQSLDRLFDSPLFDREHHETGAESVVEVVKGSTNLRLHYIAYTIILLYGQTSPSSIPHPSSSRPPKADTVSPRTSIYRSLQQSSRGAMIPRLVHHIWAGFYALQAQAALGEAPIDGADAIGETSEAVRTRSLQIRMRGLAMRLLYEICRVQKLEEADIRVFDDAFIDHLFDLVEETRCQRDESFNYAVMKLLVAVNEQFMVSSLHHTHPHHTRSLHAGIASPNYAQTFSSRLDTQTPPAGYSHQGSGNPVLGVLALRLNRSKTFGENLIFMLNRASSSDAEDLCMQLLVLKMLYLLFTTPETAHYFYTNDLKVLVDVFVRELVDLPEESESLRHTYLRVLHPLLTQTQLCTYPYKRPSIRRVLLSLLSYGHIRDISPTTRRLTERILKAEWCVELEKSTPVLGLGGPGEATQARVESIGGGTAANRMLMKSVSVEGLPILSSSSPTSSGSMRSMQAVAAAKGTGGSPSLSPTFLYPASAGGSTKGPHESSLSNVLAGSLSLDATLAEIDVKQGKSPIFSRSAPSTPPRRVSNASLADVPHTARQAPSSPLARKLEHQNGTSTSDANSSADSVKPQPEDSNGGGHEGRPIPRLLVECPSGSGSSERTSPLPVPLLPPPRPASSAAIRAPHQQPSVPPPRPRSTSGAARPPGSATSSGFKHHRAPPPPPPSRLNRTVSPAHCKS